MQALVKIWQWLKRFGLAIAGVVLALAGVGWLWARHRESVGALQDELAVERAQNAIRELKAVRAHVLNSADVKKEQIESIDADIARNKRAIIEAHENGKGLSDDEVEDAFARLGY
jgi:hypothetical protein